MNNETRSMPEAAVENEQAEQAVQTSSSAVSDEQLVAMLVDRARNERLQLTGEDGLLQQPVRRSALPVSGCCLTVARADCARAGRGGP